MTRATALRAVAYAATAVPLAFGVLRYSATGNDLRYVWMTLAAFAAAELVLRVGGKKFPRPAAQAGVVLIASSMVAFVTAYAVGARNNVSMTIVSLSFGGCFAVSAMLRQQAAAAA